MPRGASACRSSHGINHDGSFLSLEFIFFVCRAVRLAALRDPAPLTARPQLSVAAIAGARLTPCARQASPRQRRDFDVISDSVCCAIHVIDCARTVSPTIVPTLEAPPLLV